VSPQVAVLERRGKFMVAEPFFGGGRGANRQAVNRDSRYSVDDLVLLRPSAPPARHGRARGGGGRAQVLRRIGRRDNARDVLEALLLDRGLDRAFDPAVQREARTSAERPVELGARRDLRDVPTFTIDPVTARDYDDAITAVSLDDGSWRVFVHIADVSAYVPPRSLVDREAYRRGTSTYVPGAVEPMLPGELSNSACSLVPMEDRLAVSVEMMVRGDEVVSSSFHRSLIRSDVRLTYDQVDRVFAGLERASDPWGAGLQAARAAAAALGSRRVAAGALALDSEEPEFSFDRAGNIVAATPVAQTEAHRLIEYLMIAANEAVARFLSARRVPTLYRVHERPEPVAVARLIEQLASLDVPTPPALSSAHMTPQQAADLAGEVSQMVADWVARTGRGRLALTRLVLRSLKQAYYDPVNRGHAGLQLASYCHFTSPIRRYPDLICHRALLSCLGGLEPGPDSAWVAEAAPWSSQRERAAMMIERDADDVARCFLLERELSALEERSPVFEGQVVGLIGAGAFVAFGARLEYQGMVPVRRLRGDWWELNEEGTALIGSRAGGAIRLGDTLDVRVDSIDTPRGRVDLAPGHELDFS
jgi:ribonuclease R